MTMIWPGISGSRPQSGFVLEILRPAVRQSGRHGVDCMPSLARQKNSNLDRERSEREKGLNTVLWIVIFTRDHATMVLIITCELMQIQKTAQSHTQTSLSTQQAPLGFIVFIQIEIWFQIWWLLKKVLVVIKCFNIDNGSRMVIALSYTACCQYLDIILLLIKTNTGTKHNRQ